MSVAYAAGSATDDIVTFADGRTVGFSGIEEILTDQGEPTQSVEPTEPEQPTEPVAPVEPTEPEQPETPTDPTLLTGTSGNDTIKGGDASETIEGLAGDDRLYGNLGADSLSGGDGADRLYGGEGSDKIYGKNGDDWIKAAAGDNVDDGRDTDMLDLTGLGAVTVTFDAGYTNRGLVALSDGDTIQFRNIEMIIADAASSDVIASAALEAAYGRDIPFWKMMLPCCPVSPPTWNRSLST